jgi:FtsH-binding integral membrane protein
VSKVYLLLSLQLLLTAGIGYLAYNSTTFRSTFINTVTVLIVSVALLAVSIVIGCCTDVFRKYALPLFLLFTAL